MYKPKKGRIAKGYSLKNTNGIAGKTYLYVWMNNYDERLEQGRKWRSLGRYEDPETRVKLREHLLTQYGHDENMKEVEDYLAEMYQECERTRLMTLEALQTEILALFKMRGLEDKYPNPQSLKSCKYWIKKLNEEPEEE